MAQALADSAPFFHEAVQVKNGVNLIFNFREAGKHNHVNFILGFRYFPTPLILNTMENDRNFLIKGGNFFFLFFKNLGKIIVKPTVYPTENSASLRLILKYDAMGCDIS